MPPPNPYDEIIRDLESRDATGNVIAQRGRSPVDVARARRLARYTNQPPALIERSPAIAGLDVRRQNVEAATRNDPPLSRWLADPDNAAIAQNDVPNLAALGATLTPWTGEGDSEFGTRIGNIFGTGTRSRAADYRSPSALTRQDLRVPIAAHEGERVNWSPSRGVRGAAGMFAEAGLRLVQGGIGVTRLIGETGGQLGIPGLGAETLAPSIAGLDVADSYVDAAIERVRPDLPFALQRSAYSGLVSATQTVGMLPLGGTATLFGLSGATTGEAYSRYRRQGAEIGEAAAGALASGMVEYLTERLPVGFLVSRFGREGTGRFLTGFVLPEFGGEQVATHVQDAIDVVVPGSNTTWEQYWASRPAAALDTAIATTVMVAVTGGAGHITQRLAPQERRIEEIGAGVMGQELLDAIMEQATRSEVRKLDPESFNDFVTQRTEGSPVSHVYLPIEAVDTYLQSEGADPEFFAPYARQIAEARRLNGDVVIPLGDAAARLAGTPTWVALREDARVSPGGMSGREAREASKTFMQELEDRGAEIAQEALADSEAAAPAAAIYERVKNELLAIGRSSREADAIAQLFAARREAAAARMGQTIEAYDKANPVSFRQAAPGEKPSEFALQQSETGLADEQRELLRQLRVSREQIEARVWRDTEGSARQKEEAVTVALEKERASNKEWQALVARIQEISNLRAVLIPKQQNLSTAPAELPGRTLLGFENVPEDSQAPAVGWSSHDLINAGSAASALKNYGRGKGIAYEAWVPVDVLPRPKGAGIRKDGSLTDSGGYAWDELSSRAEMPPATIRINAQGRVSILDGNHRIAFWMDQGSDYIPAFVIDERTDAASLEHAGAAFMQDKARGQTQFFPTGETIVTLFESANLSTLIHELGHTFLEEMARDAASKAAPQELKDDFAILSKWFSDNGHALQKNKIPVEAHELFARGFERYAMEGKAPSAELRGVFGKFRAWLLNIYQVVQNLRAPITPEVREVFARMLATQDAIAANTETATPLFTDAKTAQMTDEEFAAYTSSIAAARDEAYDALLFKTMAAIRRREQSRFREQRDNVRGEVTAEVNGQPLFVALHLLRTGRWLNDAERDGVDLKINTGWLIDTYGEEVLGKLPRGLPITKGDGMDGDSIAEITGFPSGDALVKSLISLREQTDALRAAGDKRSVKDVLIAEQVETEMAARHGDAMTDGSIEEEAIAAINSARQGEIIAGEMRQLTKRKALLGGPTPYRIAREWARRKIMAERITDVVSRSAIQRYIRATAKAAKLAEEAILADDVNEAFRQKQAQLLNHALLAEAKIAADEVETIVARMGRYARRKAMKSVDQDYFDRVHELLERFDFRQRSQRAISEKDSFETWAARRQAEGFEVHVPPRLQFAEHYSRINMETLAALNDAVTSLVALGRKKQTFLDNKAERTFNEWRDLAKANIASLPQRKLGDNPSDEKKRRFVALGVGGLKIEEIADELDVEDPNGPFNNLLVKRATEAANVKDSLKAEILDPIAEIYFSLPPALRRWLGEKVTSNRLTWNAVNEGDPRRGQPVTMTRMEWVGVALNTGNISNLEKMTKGETWNPKALQEELFRILDKKDAWDFVQALWTQVNKLWPRIAETERELSGVVPEQIEPLEIETPFGTYKGGYWPVVYDVGRSVRAANNEAEAANDLFGFKSGIGTPKGHTITRTNARGPMTYRVEEILFTHVDRVTTRIAYAAWARDVLRAIDNDTIAGIIKTRLGREYLDQIKPWLRRQINGNMIDKRGSAELDRWMRGFRVNMSIAVMGFSQSTMMAQAWGLGQSASRIGLKWVGMGFKELAKAPFEMQAFIYERSPEMQRRGREVNREIVEFFKTLNVEQGKTAKAKQWYRNAQAAAFWHIAWMDRWAVAMPTWLGAYHKALSEGMTDEEASTYGDKMVRLSQGSGREKDLSAWQSPNNESNRFWTMFYTPFNVYLNMQWKARRRMKRGDWRGAVQMILWSTLAITLGDAMMAGDWPWDEEEEKEKRLESLARWFSRNLFFGLWSSVPIARDVANVTERHIIGEYAEMQTPIEAMYNAVERALKEGHQVYEGEEDVSGETIRAEASAIGYVFGLPGNQIGKTSGFFYDLTTGNAEPDSVRDWYSGLAYGRVPEEE